MKREIKEQWVAALRSGKYKQGHGFLHMEDKFCCLGVLCELAREAGVVETHKVPRGPVHYGADGDMRQGWLPEAVVKWSGVPNETPSVLHEGLNVELMALNDIGKLSFAQIADLIEQSL